MPDTSSEQSPADPADGSRDVLAVGCSTNGGDPPTGEPVALASADEHRGKPSPPTHSNSKGTVHATDDSTVIQRPAPVHSANIVVETNDVQPVISGADDFTREFTPGVNQQPVPPLSETPADNLQKTVHFASGESPSARNTVDTIIGPYAIMGELGRGGMGVVYKARHRQLQRFVALKMILRAEGADDELLARFRLEAQSVATLKHPGIVQIHEYGEHQGIPWFSLEFVEGPTLSQIAAKTPLEPRRAAGIVADLAAAVAYAHARGVLHRDIKPANVLVAAGDHPKLTDFGLAKRVTDDDASEHKTLDGQILGTPSYMPPEQARGATTLVGPSSDQYSLGATLYHLLTGRAPFVGSKAIDVVLQVIGRDPLSVRQLQPTTPLDLETICLKAMAKEPARRYPDCAALEADLRRFLRYEPIVARPISGVERSLRWCRRNPKIAIPIATAAISVLAALGVSVWSSVALAAKNADIERQKDAAVSARLRADQNAALAQGNALQAEANAKLAYRRAVEAKDSVAEMLLAIRNTIPSSEEKLRPVREQLLRIASKQLDRLPDEAGDENLTTGLEKARVLQERYLTALELGEPSQAIEHLDAAEAILRSRNASQATDVTRVNLTTVLYRQAQARASVHRDMEQVCRWGHESLQILDDVLAHPSPVAFDVDRGSVPRIDTLTQVLIQGYQHALMLKKLGRVHVAFEVLERALLRFDEAMAILRAGPFQQLTDEQWAGQKQVFRGMLADQEQLRATLLAAVGRQEEATTEQLRILENLRHFAAVDPSPMGIESQLKLSLALDFSGDIARQQGRRNDALKAYEESVNMTRALYQHEPALEDRRNRHHVSLMRLAGVLRESDLSKARTLYAEARLIALEMVRADREAITKKVALALVSPFSVPPAEAAALAHEIVMLGESQGPIDAELEVDAARVFATAAESAVIADPSAIETAAEWKQRALSLLKHAVTAGYRDGAYLAGEPDFTSLQSQSEFQTLLEQCVVATSPSG